LSRVNVFEKTIVEAANAITILHSILRDLAPTELSPIEPVTVNEIGLVAGDFSVCEPSTPSGTGVLQDLAGVQVPLLAGVVSLLIGDALQDRFAVFARELVDRGKRVLAAER
jgi:hypothetical protein